MFNYKKNIKNNYYLQIKKIFVICQYYKLKSADRRKINKDGRETDRGFSNEKRMNSNSWFTKQQNGACIRYGKMCFDFIR